MRNRLQQRMGRIRAAVFIAIPLLALQSLAPTANGQSRGTLDLRNQPAPIFEEQQDAVRFNAMSTADENPLPLRLTLNYVVPVSLETGKALVEMSIQNVGRGTFRLPVSREMKLLHVETNGARRMFVCSMRLSSGSFSEETITAGFVTYSSTEDRSSVVELRPQESILLTYEASVRLAWQTDAGKWRQAAASGTVVTSVECGQETLALPPNAVKNERRYVSAITAKVRSVNTIPLTVGP